MIERIIGNIIATLLTILFLVCIIYSLFLFLFNDGRGASLYGNRGNDYMYDDY
jgi:hypothetical protein